jgi:hypothetical protein
VRERVAGPLLFLHARPVSRIVRLTVDDVSHIDDHVLPRLGDLPAPVPASLADLLLTLIDNGTNTDPATNATRAGCIPVAEPDHEMLVTATIRRLAGIAGL